MANILRNVVVKGAKSSTRTRTNYIQRDVIRPTKLMSTISTADPKRVDPREAYTVKLEYEGTDTSDVKDIVNELTLGPGHVKLSGLFSKDDVDNARDTIMYLAETQGSRATHFQGKGKPETQARVWNLLNKGQIFEKIIQHPKILAILDPILGDDCQLGSVAANVLFPGGSGQEPHIDYPYWDYFSKKHWPVPPKSPEIQFHMNIQVTVMLHDFTKENGATAVLPGSQKNIHYPDDADSFYANCIQTEGKTGDVVMFPGLINHCAMPNKSNKPRGALLMQYLPKYIRPMEDQRRLLQKTVMQRATPQLRRLLAVDYPYPAIMDELDPINSEGANSDFDWK
ncbi:unnamed protein product [Owenia fusiformis]|uniref:Uncharacterized protein n=1 Tax=Owenia fusiformis TaxID=6347 RepID=A0A8J1UMW4_OWEFU|nr:unnamed protein product [Owenia fusiformis]